MQTLWPKKKMCNKFPNELNKNFTRWKEREGKNWSIHLSNLHLVMFDQTSISIRIFRWREKELSFRCAHKIQWHMIYNHSVRFKTWWLYFLRISHWHIFMCVRLNECAVNQSLCTTNLPVWKCFVWRLFFWSAIFFRHCRHEQTLTICNVLHWL